MKKLDHKRANQIKAGKRVSLFSKWSYFAVLNRR
ncbi:hypothetical protein IGJ34_003009 [Enterococcus sp. AZ177]